MQAIDVQTHTYTYIYASFHKIPVFEFLSHHSAKVCYPIAYSSFGVDFSFC